MNKKKEYDKIDEYKGDNYEYFLTFEIIDSTSL